MSHTNSKSSLFFLHEVGARSHILALEEALTREGTKLHYGAFRIFYLLRNGKTLGEIFSYINLLLYLTFFKGNTVVVAIAPCDWRLFLLWPCLIGNRWFFHTSWPIWDGSDYPKTMLSKLFVVRKSWEYFLNGAERIFSVNSAGARSISENFNPKNEPVVVGHAVDGEIFHPKNRIAADSEPVRAIFVGRMVPKKGLNTIFRIARKFSPRELQITFVGDGLHVHSVKDFSKDFPQVNYYGSEHDRARLAQMYRESHFLFLPSQRVEGWQELFGIVVIEAMSCGVIPVTTDHVGPVDIIEHKRSGYYFGEEEYVEATAKLLREMSADRNILQKVGANTVERSKQFHAGARAELWATHISG